MTRLELNPQSWTGRQRPLRLPLPERVICWLERRAARTPYFDLPGFMERSWLLRIGRRQNPDGHIHGRWLSVKLHRILRSDADRDLHNHPWFFLSLILRGTYSEEREIWGGVVERHRYRAGDLLWRPHGTAHRIDILQQQPVTTLFIQGRKISSWGFYTPVGFVHWRRYVARPPASRIPPGKAQAAMLHGGLNVWSVNSPSP